MQHSLLFLTRCWVRLLGLLLLLGTSLLAQAQVIRYVKPVASGTGDGSSWPNASGNLQAIINASAATDQVWVAAGLYKPTTTTDRTISFALQAGVAVYGGFTGSESSLSQRPVINPLSSQPSSTTLSGDIGTAGTAGDNSYHVINNPGGLTSAALLDGFVITGGNANGSGTRESGGGMYNASSNPSVTNCLFQANTASNSGGGMYNEASSLSVTNCSFQANTAEDGAGMYNEASNSSVTNCSFQANSAIDDGGGMENASSNTRVTNCSFQANSARNGGGMENNRGSNPIVTNCSFQANSARSGGAGMDNTGSSRPSVTNCSFQANTASNGGGGMENVSNSSPSVTNCVFFDNGGSRTIYNSSSSSVSVSYSLFDAAVTEYTNGVGNRTTTTSPFASPTTTQLSACSPAIDAGTNSASALVGITTDLAGNPRFFNNGTVDMGAYEWQATASIALISQPPAGSAVCPGGSVTLSVRTTGSLTGYQWYKDGQVLSPAQPSASLSLTGVQPADAGSYALVVTGACNSVTSTASSLTVNASPVATLTASPSAILSCTQTSLSLTAGGGTSYTFSGPGVVSQGGNQATVNAPGTYSVTVTNAGGCSSVANTRVQSNTALVTLANPTASAATAGQAFSQSFTASGGSSPYSYSLASGSLPTGLNLSTTGVLSGTPTQTGSFTITTLASDATGCSGVSAPYGLTVSAPPSPIRYVRMGGTGSGNSWADASGDLQSQINFTGASQVWVAAGLYKPTTTTDRTISFALKNGVAIYGGFPATGNPILAARNPDSFTTVLSGDIGAVGTNEDNSHHVVYNPGGLNASALLDGVVITGGNANAYVDNRFSDKTSGGGMYNLDSSPTLINCRFMTNSATYLGGGMYNKRSATTLINCRFMNNSAGYGNGGGMANEFNSNPTLTNCSFLNNSGNFGGGMDNEHSSPTLTNCSFVGNYSYEAGGGMSSSFSFPAPSLTNCSFLNNATGYLAGAVYNRACNATLTNCVVFGNGGANTFYDETSYRVLAAYSLFEAGVTGYEGENNLTTTVSPFVSPTDARLNACALAINTGTNAANSTTTDLAGNPRIVNTTIDRGAYEFQGTPTQPVAITQQPVSGSSVCVGSRVTAMISVSGTSPTYQWYKDGAPLTSLASATSATLILGSVQVGDAGSYSVVVSSSSCPVSVTSTVFSLRVNNPAPPTLLTQTGQNYPGGRSSVTVDLNSGSVNLVASGCNGTINWTGLDNSSGTSSPIVVSTDRVGQFVYTATCTSTQGCVSPATSATVTVQGRLTVLHRDVDNYATNNAIQPLLVLQNQGLGTLPLSAITLRYYVTVEGASTLGNLSVNYAQVGNQNVKLKYVPLQPLQQGAAGYVEVSFTTGAGSLASGSSSGPIQGYFTRADYGGLNEADDYSYAQVRDQLVGNLRITAYYNGVLIAGIEPGSAAQIRALRALTESKNGPSATQINTYLTVRNEGNVPVNYRELKARYYFTSDGPERLQVEVDEGNVRAQLVALSPAVGGANYYLELTYLQSGQLAPGASADRVRYRISKPEGGRFNQTNDYSYQEQPSESSSNGRVTLYVGTERAWGTEPSGAARLAAPEPATQLEVTVMGNPLRGDVVSMEIRGAAFEPLQIQLVTTQGQVITSKQVASAQALEQQQLSLAGQNPGVFLLQVSSPAQSRTIRVLKVD